MAWHHVGDETTCVPQFATREGTYVREYPGGWKQELPVTQSTNMPTGEVVEVTHSFWRCGNCRALACTAQGEKPAGNCGKCGSRG